MLTQTRRRDRARACTGDALIEGRRAERILAIRDRKQRHLEMKALGREVLEGVVAPARVHQVTRDHRVHRQTAEVGARPAERAPRGLGVVRDLLNGVVLEEPCDRGGHAFRRRHVPRTLPGRETDADQRRMAPREVGIGVNGYRADRTELARDGIRVEIRDERRLDRRRHHRGRLEPELQLTAPHRAGERRRRRRCGQVLVGGRKPRDQASELEVAEELEHARPVVGAAPRAIELEGHRQIGDDRRELSAFVDLVLVGGERLAEPGRVSR